MADVGGVRHLLDAAIIDFLGGVITALLSLIVMFRISMSMTALALVVNLVFVSALRQALRRVRPIFREGSDIQAQVTSRLAESLAGIRVVKGYNAEEREARTFSLGVQRLFDNVVRSIGAVSLLTTSATILVGGVGAAMIYIGVRKIEAHTLTLGDFIAFTAFLAFMIAPLLNVANVGAHITEALAGLDRVYELLAEPEEDADSARPVRLGRIRGDVVFENVSFSYTGNVLVLHHICFEAPAGSATALVGPSGSGKSTIIGLIASFYTPGSGTVWLDGFDLRTVSLSSYRAQLGLVLQDPFLFDGTIRDNVAFAKPNATDAELMRACEIAGVDQFARGFPDRYETRVGERGVRLSGGQKQRVSIARAVLAEPRILILDEATSSLDSESEALIQEGLKFLMRDRTTFVIAHRLSTIRRASQILVIENGRIIERGTHSSLYALRRRYFDSYTRQHGLESSVLFNGEAEYLPSDLPGSRAQPHFFTPPTKT
jgi:ABC-type multidrug transport system fused ATPase/permease subunit